MLERTMTVKELIKELLEFDMDEPVYIGTGEDTKPTGCSGIHSIGDYCTGGLPFEFGVYLIPNRHLERAGDDV